VCVVARRDPGGTGLAAAIGVSRGTISSKGVSRPPTWRAPRIDGPSQPASSPHPFRVVFVMSGHRLTGPHRGNRGADVARGARQAEWMAPVKHSGHASVRSAMRPQCAGHGRFISTRTIAWFHVELRSIAEPAFAFVHTHTEIRTTAGNSPGVARDRPPSALCGLRSVRPGVLGSRRLLKPRTPMPEGVTRSPGVVWGDPMGLGYTR
jgi:hypothetical protein